MRIRDTPSARRKRLTIARGIRRAKFAAISNGRTRARRQVAYRK